MDRRRTAVRNVGPYLFCSDSGPLATSNRLTADRPTASKTFNTEIPANSPCSGLNCTAQTSGSVVYLGACPRGGRCGGFYGARDSTNDVPAVSWPVQLLRPTSR